MVEDFSKARKNKMYDRIKENCKKEISLFDKDPEYQMMLCGIYEEVLPMLESHQGCPDELLEPLAESDRPLSVLNDAVSFQMMCEHYGIDPKAPFENDSDEPVPFS